MQINEYVFECQYCGELSSRKVHPIHVNGCVKNPKNMKATKKIDKPIEVKKIVRKKK